MSTGIVDNQIISDVNLWKHTVYGKFIIVLAKRTGDIVFVVAWCIFFAEDSDMMISTVHSRTHQITGTSVQTNIFFVNMFLMNTFCYEIAIRSKHEAAKFCKDGYITKSCRHQDFLKLFADTFTDYCNIVWLFVRCIWNTDTTA